MICEYGCGQEASYQFKNGKWCCSNNHGSCPSVKNKIKNIIHICPKCELSFGSHGYNSHKKICKGKLFCLNCEKQILYPKRFCNHRCAAIYNNDKKDKKQNYCLYCNSEINSEKYCDNSCRAKYVLQNQIDQWLSGELDGCSKGGHASYVKKYLQEKYDNKCSLCGWSERNPYTGNIPLEVEHIDGNAYNNHPDNVTLICPNCHSLTESYRGANKGKGRREYLKEYYIKDNEGNTI